MIALGGRKLLPTAAMIYIDNTKPIKNAVPIVSAKH